VLSAAGNKPLPEVIDLCLVCTMNLKRDRFGELELRTTVERKVWDARKIKANHLRAFRRTSVATSRRAHNLIDAAVREERDIKLRRLFPAPVKPETRIRCCHGGSLAPLNNKSAAQRLVYATLSTTK
jgi:hypothetical protein